MEIKQAAILESSEPLSKAITKLNETPAVIVTKEGRYHGIIDHRSISFGMSDASKTKCENAMVNPPTMVETATIMEQISAYLLGHFKALPVIDHQEMPIGITTRVEALKEIDSEKKMPKGGVDILMNSPVFEISEDDDIATLKRLLKEKNARRMVVTKSGSPIGVVSSFDVSSWTSRPNFSAGRKDVYSENKNIDQFLIKDFLRPDITVVTESETISGAARKMIEKEVSSVIVVANGKSVGILSALDIFKKIQDLEEDRLAINISGLNEENRGEFSHINEKIGGVIDKFKDSFNIRNVSVHTKEGKSTVTVNIYFDTDNGHISLRGERMTMKETVDELADELDTMLRRKKDQKVSSKYYKETF